MKAKIDTIFPKEEAMKKVSSVLTLVQEQQLGEIEGHIQCVFQEKAEQ